MKLSFPHTDLLIEHLAQGTKVSSILFDHGSGAVGSIQGTSSPVLWTVEGKPPCSHGSPHR